MFWKNADENIIMFKFWREKKGRNKTRLKCSKKTLHLRGNTDVVAAKRRLNQ